ncbi:MAG TPA: hypothetical protein PKE64_25815 [Anaerolineae bacterium]|nr:hypothetical protein [Anaerolineae bacterium]
MPDPKIDRIKLYQDLTIRFPLTVGQPLVLPDVTENLSSPKKSSRLLPRWGD